MKVFIGSMVGFESIAGENNDGIRLYGEAIEFAETGKITLPRPNAEELIAIRRGKYKLTEIEEMGRDLESKLLQAREVTQLPNRIDRDKVSELLVGIYRMAWDRNS